MYWWFTSIYADLCYSHSYPTCMRHTFESLSAHFRWAARSDCWGPTLAHFNFRASDEAGCEELIRMRFLVSPSKTSNNLGWSWMSSEKKNPSVEIRLGDSSCKQRQLPCGAVAVLQCEGFEPWRSTPLNPPTLTDSVLISKYMEIRWICNNTI